MNDKNYCIGVLNIFSQSHTVPRESPLPGPDGYQNRKLARQPYPENIIPWQHVLWSCRHSETQELEVWGQEEPDLTGIYITCDRVGTPISADGNQG